MVAIWARLWRRKRQKLRTDSAKFAKLQGDAQRAGAKALCYLALIIAVHTLAMVIFEEFSFGDSLWLTLTSITTVGYGDISASTAIGRLSTVIILYAGGIFLVGNMAGDFFDYRSLRRDAIRNGNWSWNKVKDHIIIIGSKNDSELHLSRLFAECEKIDSTQGQNIILISESFEDSLPSTLQDFDIKYIKGRGNSPDVLEKSGHKNAQIIVILAWDEEDEISDGYAFDIISRIRDKGGEAKIVAECVNDANRQRLEKAGASLVLRPVRAYPEIILGGLLNLGSTEILENLFTAEGERIVRTDVILDDSWANIVSEYVRKDLGTPVAYRDATTGKIITSPPGSTIISANALFALGG
jgi:voltage-gated potassium channel